MTTFITLAVTAHFALTMLNIFIYRQVFCVKYKFIPQMRDLLYCLLPIMNIAYLIHNLVYIVSHEDMDKLASKILRIKGE